MFRLSSKISSTMNKYFIFHKLIHLDVRTDWQLLPTEKWSGSVPVLWRPSELCCSWESSLERFKSWRWRPRERLVQVVLTNQRPITDLVSGCEWMYDWLVGQGKMFNKDYSGAVREFAKMEVRITSDLVSWLMTRVSGQSWVVSGHGSGSPLGGEHWAGAGLAHQSSVHVSSDHERTGQSGSSVRR